MPYGGDPVRELGPNVLKGCAIVVLVGVVSLIVLGLLIGAVL